MPTSIALMTLDWLAAFAARPSKLGGPDGVDDSSFRELHRKAISDVRDCLAHLLREKGPAVVGDWKALLDEDTIFLARACWGKLALPVKPPLNFRTYCRQR